MKRILVKIGKVWSLIQRDGFLRASARAASFFWGSFHRVGEGQILYVTGGIGDSALYRGKHVAEELNAHGFVAATTTQDNPFLVEYIDRFDIFVLHRVGCSSRIENFLEQAKEAGKTVLFETDDLTFDGDRMRKTSTYEKMNTLERSQYRDGQSKCVMDDEYVSHATTTTETLATHLRSQGKQVYVVPNKISQAFIAIAKSVREENLPKAVPDHFTIGYFSGSASHDRDFAVASEALISIMKKYEKVHLLIAGPLTLSRAFDEYRSRIIRKLYMSRYEYFACVASCDINIAPLEIGDDFCESKSAIKYYEAGIVSVPVVASKTKEFSNIITDGITGYVAETSEQWVQKIEICIKNTHHCKKVGIAAYDDIIKNHITTSPGNEEYYAFLRQKIDGSISENIEPLKRQPDTTDTAIVIVNWNGKEMLKKCLESLAKQTDQNFAVIVIDNGSEDGSRELIKKDFPLISWVELSENKGFAHPTNIGIRAALRSPNIQYIIALNNDTQCDEEFVATLRGAIRAQQKNPDARVGALQPKVLNYYDKEQLDTTGVLTSFDMSAVNRGINEKDEGQYDKKRNIFGPSGSAPLYTRAALEETMLPHAGYYDKDYFAYYEDVDLAWRLWHAGWDVHFVPKARVYHIHSATGKKNSPFKAFHIHRNHFYNMIKNAPFFYLPLLVLFTPVRYILVAMSILWRSGPAARLRDNARAQEKTSIVRIVFRSWKDVLENLGSLRRKRRFIAQTKKRPSYKFPGAIARHYFKLRDVIFK